MTYDLRLGSCLDPRAGLASLADKSVDVDISDPPYDEHTHTKGRGSNSIAAKAGARESTRPGTRAAKVRTRELGFDAISLDEMRAVSRERVRVTRRWLLTFCAVEMVGDSAKDGGKGWRAALEQAGAIYYRTIIWHKLGSTPQFTGDKPAQAVEAIVLAHPPGRTRWNAGGKHGYYAHPIVLERVNGANPRLHTTQKPLSLLRELVEDFTDPGETVLDCYAGSATTLLACEQLGRNSIGWEKSAENYEVARRRLELREAKPRPEQPSLFDALEAR